MGFRYLVLVWGLGEVILGIYTCIKTNSFISKIILQSYAMFSGNVEYGDLINQKRFSKWIGEIVVIEGALYTFLASASIFYNINIIFIIIFIIIIELFFFKVITKGIKWFL